MKEAHQGNSGPVHVVFPEDGSRSGDDSYYGCKTAMGVLHTEGRGQLQLAPDPGPPEMVDYVVVHELVHLGQPDHSKKFWDKVRKIMPDYELRRHWLQDHVGLLKI